MSRTARRRTVWSLFALVFVALPNVVLALPASPRRFVDNLDERCYVLLQPPPAPGVTLKLAFLDPVLVAKGLQAGTFTLQPPPKICVPVEKNNTPPPPDTLPYMSYLDWLCYGITGPSLNLTLDLTQLNPIMSTLFGPTVTVNVGVPQQLCVPVYKNNVIPPSDVQHLVDYVDVECFAVTSTQQIANKPITLTHLNPLFSGRPPENLTFPTPGPSQLCVPVAKEGDIPPADVLPYVEYSDVLCYPLGGISLDSLLTLTQLDPVMIPRVGPTNISAGRPLSLCVPVAKNGDIPPGTP